MVAPKFAALGALSAGIIGRERLTKHGSMEGCCWPWMASFMSWLSGALDKIVKAHCWCSGIMLASHACDPGSIPGQCTARFFLFFASGSAPRLPLRSVLSFLPMLQTSRCRKYGFRPNWAMLPLFPARKPEAGPPLGAATPAGGGLTKVVRPREVPVAKSARGRSRLYI